MASGPGILLVYKLIVNLVNINLGDFHLKPPWGLSPKHMAFQDGTLLILRSINYRIMKVQVWHLGEHSRQYG
jgi:hypothetical protein